MTRWSETDDEPTNPRRPIATSSNPLACRPPQYRPTDLDDFATLSNMGGIEASVDMSDQATIWNETTGQWEKTQITSNLETVEQGHSTLVDPEGLGHTYTTKVMESYAPGNHLDAYRQATTSVDTLDACRDGYTAQDHTVADLPPRVSDGMEIIRQVDAGDISPDVADARLAELGYDKDLPDFMESVSGQFASLTLSRRT